MLTINSLPQDNTMLSINSLPQELMISIFNYLTHDDLKKANLVQKRFWQTAQSENLSSHLSLPKLISKVIQENALNLWNHPEGNFYVNKKGKLVLIAFYHLGSKLYKWYDHERMAKKVNRVVEITLKEIYRMNMERADGLKRMYVWSHNWFFVDYYPIDYLADIILNSKQFTNIKIKKAALLIKNQANLYNHIQDKYYTKFNLLPKSSDKRIARSEYHLDEAFFDFCNYFA